MMSPQIKLVGYLDVPSDRWDNILEALDIHIDKTRTEAGCISFNVTPCPDVPFRLLVFELFRDQAAFDAHQKRATNSSWAEISAGIPRHYKISEVTE